MVNAVKLKSTQNTDDSVVNAMSGDISFDNNLQRCIGVDVRYMLFVIDKWGKAKNLIKELKVK